MDLNEYQRKALRTLAPSSGGGALQVDPQLGQLICAGLGLTGEAGEFADHVKKLVFHSQPITPERHRMMIKELGDVMWYVSVGAAALGVSLDDVGRVNIDKLSERHPEGWDPGYHVPRGVPADGGP
jgi:NTP pyrophosphatase (non-canonical NTP hydrolase)